MYQDSENVIKQKEETVIKDDNTATSTLRIGSQM
jgi:hypothetical protein